MVVMGVAAARLTGTEHDLTAAPFSLDDQTALIKKALLAEGIAETAFPPRTVLAAISSAKNKLVGVAQYEATAEEYFAKRVARLYRRYQHLLAEASGVDFDDLMFRLARFKPEEKAALERWQQGSACRMPAAVS